MAEYPEHEKLHALKDKRDVAQEFLDWLLDDRNLRLCRRHEHDDRCYDDDDGSLEWGYRDGELLEVVQSRGRYMADFLDVDSDKLEAEKRAMLDAMRADHERRINKSC